MLEWTYLSDGEIGGRDLSTRSVLINPAPSAIFTAFVLSGLPPFSGLIFVISGISPF
jgi:hypothetical protein